MSEQTIRNTIIATFNEKPILMDIAADQDFFDLGASSLTVVDLQIQIEQTLKLEVDTSKLMANPTIDGWVDIYSGLKS